MTLQLDSSEMQKIAREMVHEHVYANVGSMVEYILEKSTEDRYAPFSYDDINLRPDPSDWDAEKLHAFITDELGATWEDATGVPWGMKETFTYADEGDDNIFIPLAWDEEPTEEEIDAARDYIRDNASPAEVYEWWAISPWLAARLQERGEITFDAGGLDVWGRGTTGQAIYMDYDIQEIAKARHEELEKYN